MLVRWPVDVGELERDQPCHDLGADYFSRRHDPAPRQANRLLAQLHDLGYTVTATPPQEAAA